MKAETVSYPRLGEIGLDNFPPYLMNRIMGRYNESLRAAVEKMGLTTPQMRALAVLSVIDGVLIRELAVYTVIGQSTLGRALSQLEAAGHVSRKTDEDDQRGVRVFITAQGREVFSEIWPVMARSYEQMFAGVPEEERRSYLATTQKILRNIRKHDF